MTNRWFALPGSVSNGDKLVHPVMSKLARDFYSDPQGQFHVVAAGRRSYKTELMKRWFVAKACSEFGKRFFVGAPTRTQAKLIFWNDLLELTPDFMQDGDPNRTELIIRYKTGSELHVVGLEAHKRIEGIRWDGCGISEYQEVTGEFFGTTLQPILNDTGGHAILEGRPVGKNHFYDDFQRATTDPELWQSYTWKSADVLTAQQIENAKKTLSDEDFRREYEADFESGGQKVYHAFGPHNVRATTLQDGPMILTCDFNAMEKPMSWVLGQVRADAVYWIKSFAYPYTNTETMCEKVKEYFGNITRPPVFELYGDYSGQRHTSNSSMSDWEIIMRAFPGSVRRTKPCMSVRNRVAATNGLLRNAAGEVRMYVHPTDCDALVKDWERVQWKANGVELDQETDKRRTHSSDAVDYWSDYEHPIRSGADYMGRTPN